MNLKATKEARPDTHHISCPMNVSDPTASCTDSLSPTGFTHEHVWYSIGVYIEVIVLSYSEGWAKMPFSAVNPKVEDKVRAN